MKKIALLYCVGLLSLLASCEPETDPEAETPVANQAILETFGTKINPNALPNYANQALLKLRSQKIQWCVPIIQVV